VGETQADTEEDFEAEKEEAYQAFAYLPIEEKQRYLASIGMTGALGITKDTTLDATYAQYLNKQAFQPKPAPFVSGTSAPSPSAPSAPVAGEASPASTPHPATSAAEASAPRRRAFAEDEGSVGATTVATSVSVDEIASARDEFKQALKTDTDSAVDGLTRFLSMNGVSIDETEIADLKKRSKKEIAQWGLGKLSELESRPSGSGLKSHRMRGKGLARAKPKRSAVERAESYEKPKPYRQFGRYLIHHHKLKDGILMLKFPSGNRIPQIPSQRVSPELTTVLKEMAEGRTPQYKHFEGMSVDDKEKFHHIVRHSQFQAVEVPPPDKEAHDKEVERFEILRGEILAGNDNKELIREFKAKLLKFSREGRIPRREANEIMEHLLMLGV
jgi:hypothetical protein